MQNAEEPALKKQKQDEQPGSNPAPDTTDPAYIFSPQLMSPQSRASLRTQYQQAQPYLHGVLRELLPPATLAQVREEIVNNIQATYKETDLFKVFQTGGRTCEGTDWSWGCEQRSCAGIPAQVVLLATHDMKALISTGSLPTLARHHAK
eukprot:1162018-Pelagomonas_calceolata.AAC.5